MKRVNGTHLGIAVLLFFTLSVMELICSNLKIYLVE